MKTEIARIELEKLCEKYLPRKVGLSRAIENLIKAVQEDTKDLELGK